MIVMAALCVVILAAVLQRYFNWRFFHHLSEDDFGRALPLRKPGQRLHAETPASVIICARNEARNLERYLPAILDQDYRFSDYSPAFEVIVVNDASTDDTRGVLERFRSSNPHLRIVDIPTDEPRLLPGKKFALSKGIRAARRNVIVCTDADCEPESRHWLHHMVAPFATGKLIVAGYGGYRKYPGFLNWFIRYETLHTFLLYFAFWKGRVPYMAVGRNLAAQKSMFVRAAEDPRWAALPSGDDDLLIQVCATTENMCVLTHPESFTWSEPKRTIEEYLAQKRRHVSTGKYYNRRSKTLLSVYVLLRAVTCLTPLMWVIVALAVIHMYEPGLLSQFFREAPAFGVIVLLLWLWVAFPNMVSENRFTYATRPMRQSTTPVGWFAFFFCWLLYNAVLAPWILWKSRQRWK